jgi:hypothetical protein
MCDNARAGGPRAYLVYLKRAKNETLREHAQAKRVVGKPPWPDRCGETLQPNRCGQTSSVGVIVNEGIDRLSPRQSCRWIRSLDQTDIVPPA